MELESQIMNMALNQGFGIVVAVYLLFERSRFNEKIVDSLREISVILKERLPAEVN